MLDPLFSERIESELFQRLTMRLVVLTGGAGTGKSTALDLFRKHSVTIIDSVDVLRSVLRASSCFESQLAIRFPMAVPKPGGPIDVKLLAAVIYSNANDKLAFEEIVGGAITKYTLVHIFIAWIHRSKIVILDSPLFFESSIPPILFHDVIMVYARRDVQFHRLTAVAGATAEVAEKRINGQIPLPYKCEMSRIVIDNEGTIEALESQIEKVVAGWATQKVPFYKYPEPLLVLALLIAFMLLLFLD
jgi:dephospho-CoA kinase